MSQTPQSVAAALSHYSLWPNDAIMCKQLIPDLYVTLKFFTTIQNLKSTTTV